MRQYRQFNGTLKLIPLPAGAAGFKTWMDSLRTKVTALSFVPNEAFAWLVSIEDSMVSDLALAVPAKLWERLTPRYAPRFSKS